MNANTITLLESMKAHPPPALLRPLVKCVDQWMFTTTIRLKTLGHLSFHISFNKYKFNNNTRLRLVLLLSRRGANRRESRGTGLVTPVSWPPMWPFEKHPKNDESGVGGVDASKARGRDLMDCAGTGVIKPTISHFRTSQWAIKTTNRYKLTV